MNQVVFKMPVIQFPMIRNREKSQRMIGIFALKWPQWPLSLNLTLIMRVHCQSRLTCCCWDWWPWASACLPFPQAKTPACWNEGTAQSRSSSCPSVKKRKKPEDAEPWANKASCYRWADWLATPFNTSPQTYIYTLCTLTSGGSRVRKLWSAAKVRMLVHWPMVEGKASISLKLQSSSSRDSSLMQRGGRGGLVRWCNYYIYSKYYVKQVLIFELYSLLYVI